MLPRSEAPRGTAASSLAYCTPISLHVGITVQQWTRAWLSRDVTIRNDMDYLADFLIENSRLAQIARDNPHSARQNEWYSFYGKRQSPDQMES